MNNSEEEVYFSVQAALLNSECGSQEAVRAALKAIVEFADGEDVFHSPKAILALKDAISHGEHHHFILRCRREIEESVLDNLTKLLDELWKNRARDGIIVPSDMPEGRS